MLSELPRRHRSVAVGFDRESRLRRELAIDIAYPQDGSIERVLQGRREAQTRWLPYHISLRPNWTCRGVFAAAVTWPNELDVTEVFGAANCT
jgi:hypothetical protein